MAAARRTTIFLALMFLNVIFTFADLPEKILCVDSNCKAPISRVQTKFSYEAPDPHYLSFEQHDVIQVFGKDADESGLWTGELLMKPGKVGLFNKDYVKELVVFNKRPGEHVDTLNFFAALEGSGKPTIIPRHNTAENRESEPKQLNESNGSDQKQDLGSEQGYLDDHENTEEDEEEEEEYDDYEDEDDDDDWSYFDNNFVGRGERDEEEEEDFLEELLDARGAEDRLSRDQERKAPVRDPKVASHGEDLDKGDLEETEKGHYSGPIPNGPSEEKMKIVEKMKEVILKSEKTDRKRQELAERDPPGGPMRGETMKMQEAEFRQEMDRLQREEEEERTKLLLNENEDVIERMKLAQNEEDDRVRERQLEEQIEREEAEIEALEEQRAEGDDFIETAETEQHARRIETSVNERTSESISDKAHEETTRSDPENDVMEKSNEEPSELDAITNVEDSKLVTDVGGEVEDVDDRIDAITNVEDNKLVTDVGGEVEDVDDREEGGEMDNEEVDNDDWEDEELGNKDDGDVLEEWYMQVVEEEPRNKDGGEESQDVPAESLDAATLQVVLQNSQNAATSSDMEENGSDQPEDLDLKDEVRNEREAILDEPSDAQIHLEQQEAKEEEKEASESAEAVQTGEDANQPDESTQTDPPPEAKVSEEGDKALDEKSAEEEHLNAEEKLEDAQDSAQKEDDGNTNDENLQTEGENKEEGAKEEDENTTDENLQTEGEDKEEGADNDSSDHLSTPESDKDSIQPTQSPEDPTQSATENPDDSVPSTFSVKSEVDIDPEAYRDILDKLSANPALRDKEGAIEQEMLRILSDPILKRNLLKKPAPAPAPHRGNILSAFRNSHRVNEEAAKAKQDGNDIQAENKNQDHQEVQEDGLNSDRQGTGDQQSDHPEEVHLPTAPAGPDAEAAHPDSPEESQPQGSDSATEDINTDDPLALLERDGEQQGQFALPTDPPPEVPQDGEDIAKEILAKFNTNTDSHQAESNPAYDPAYVSEPGNSVHGPSSGHTPYRNDPAMEALESNSHLGHGSPAVEESADNNPVTTSPPTSNTLAVNETAEPTREEESASSIDANLPNADQGTLDSSYGEPGIRTGIRVDDEEQAEQDILDHLLEDEDVLENEGNPKGETYLDENPHHQMYTKEENVIVEEAVEDDGVTVEVEKEEPEGGEEKIEVGEGGDWLDQLMKSTEHALEAVNESIVVPIMQMFPPQFQDAMNKPDFLGIPWITILILACSWLSLFFILSCCLMCGSRRNRSIQSYLSREVELLIAQKAEVMDALEMTTAQFQKQNLENFELKSAMDSAQQDRSKIEKKYKELDRNTQDQHQDVEKTKAALKKKTSENEAYAQKIKSLENQAKKSASTISELTSKVQDLEGRIYAGEEECSHLRHDVSSLEEQNQQLKTSKAMLEEEISGWNERVSELSEQIQLMTREKKDMDESLTYKDNEIEVLKDCLLQLKGLESAHNEGPEVDSEAKIQQLLDVTRVNARLSLVQNEREELQAKLDQELKAGRELETKVGSLEQENDNLRMEHTKVKSNLTETHTKMEVLQEYFKSKEVELQRKLGREEALKLQSDEQLTNLSEKAVSAEVDINTYRQQIVDLKAELEKSERTFRTQINAHEKKSHDTWLVSRTAEREVQEAKREAASLRHRLTELEGRRATSENTPLVKPQAAAPSPLRVVSPSFRPGGSRASRRGPSRNSLIEADSPSPPMIDPRHRDSPASRSRLSPSMDRDLMPPPHPDDFTRHSPYGREPLPPHHPADFGGPGPYGPPPPHGDFPPDFRPHPDDLDFGPPGDFGPRGPPPGDFGPRGPPPPDFGPPHRFPPPGMGEFDPHRPMDPGFDPRFGPPPPHPMDMDPRGPPPMHGPPGPFPGDMPPPFERRGPPPPGMRPSGPFGPMDGPRTSSPSVPDRPQGPRGPPSRQQPPNMQA